MSSSPPLRSLKGDWAFRRLRRGRAGGSKLLSLRWLPSTEPGIRVGIVASRKVGNAVTRNLLRRRTRGLLLELIRDDVFASERNNGGLDLIIILKPVAANSSYTELKKALIMALERAKV